MSTGFNAGIDTSDVVVSYGEETAWAALPAVAFKELRLTGEGFAENKTRQRPAEIRADGQAAHAITTQIQAEGSLNFAFSYGTYDDLLEGLLNGDWSTPLAINSVANDISADSNVEASGNPGFLSSTTDKFNAVKVGQWIRVFGFIASAGINNGIYRVISKTTGASPAIQVAGAEAAQIVDETPASGTQQIRGTMLRNGVVLHSYFFQKELASNLFLTYPGTYVTGGNLNAQLGNFMEGSLNFICASEAKATTDSSTGAATAAPTGRVIDTVSGFSNLEQDDTAVSAVIQGVSVSLEKENARSQFGLGSAAAQGMGRGTVNVSGTLSVYFSSFTLYDLYTAETDLVISFRAFDNTDQGYIITFPAATLMNPQIVAGGPDTDVVAEFELEGNPVSLAAADGEFTIQIDKIPAIG